MSTFFVERGIIMQNKSKKLMAFGGAALMLTTVFAAMPAQAVSAADPAKIVILGDSISAGYGLKTGECGYYDYLADCIGGTVTNYAVSGYATQDLLDLLDDTSKQSAVSAADYICISIGANDLVRPARAYVEKSMKEGETVMDTLKRLAKEGDATQVISDLTRELREPRKIAKANYITIESKLRELNPNAQIVFQTLYNPFEIEASVLAGYSDKNKDNYTKLKNYICNTEKDLNNALKDLTKSKTADVSAAFADTGWIYVRTAESDIHPTPLGHALIAATILDTLGISASKSSRLGNLFANLPADILSQIPANDLAAMQKYKGEAQPVPTISKGDYDNDGEVTAMDAQSVLVAYTEGLATGTVNMTAEQKAASDIDGDGEITAADAQYILLYFTENTVTGNPTTWDQLLKKTA